MMTHDNTAIFVQHSIEPDVCRPLLPGARYLTGVTCSAAVRITLAWTAVVLHRLLPIAWALVPDKAQILAGLVSGCNALADRMA